MRPRAPHALRSAIVADFALERAAQTLQFKNESSSLRSKHVRSGIVGRAVLAWIVCVVMRAHRQTLSATAAPRARSPPALTDAWPAGGGWLPTLRIRANISLHEPHAIALPS
jgi:hypothetical protein